MRRSTVHESQTRLSQAKFLLVLLVLKFQKSRISGNILYTTQTRESESANIVGAHV